MKAIPANVYEPKGIGNCSNNGISARYRQILLICDSGHITVTGDEENLCETEQVGSFVYVRPHKEPDPGNVGWMDGGSIVYAYDSRFPSPYPLCLHDRQETQEQYDLLSQ